MTELFNRLPARILISVMLVVTGMGIARCGFTQSRSALNFELRVNPQADRYVAMLEHPPYLALAIENAGIKLTRSTGIEILDAESLRYKTATLRFVKRSGQIYSYEASIDWDIGMVQTSFNLPIEADVSGLDKGKVIVRVFLPLAKLLPQDLIGRIGARVQGLADPNLQQRVIDYFDAIKKKRATDEMEDILHEVLVQAYNKRVEAGGSMALHEPGDAEPLSDQLLLLITLFIWFIIVPLVALGRYIRRRMKARRAAE